MSDDNRIVYISGPGYSPEVMSPIFDDVSSWCQGIIEKFSIASAESRDISIRFCIGYEYRDEYEDINAFAARDLTGNADYKICFYASLIYNQWLSSRLPIGQEQPFESVLDGLNAPDGHNKAEHLANVMLFISTVFVFCHELSHILLGHVDWRSKKNGAMQYLEVDSGIFSPQYCEASLAMEAEADALAASLLLTVCSFSCLSDRTFKSVQHGLWTLAFSTTMVMHMFENKILLTGPAQNRTHPAPPERWFMFLAHLLPNAKKMFGNGPSVEPAIIQGAATAFKLSGLGALHSTFDLIAHASLMEKIGTQLDRLDLDQYRLFLKSSTGLTKVRVA